MKKIISILLFFAACLHSVAQIVSAPEELVRQRVLFYNVGYLIQNEGKFLFQMNEKNKLKPIKPESIANYACFTQPQELFVLSIENIKGKRYLHAQTSTESFYFLIDSKFTYYKNTRLIAEFENIKSQYQSKYAYTKINPDHCDPQYIEAEQYTKLYWIGYDVPTTLNEELVWTISYAGDKKKIKTREIGPGFYSQEQFDKFKADYEEKLRLIELERQRVAREDSINDRKIIWATLNENIEKELSDSTIALDKGDSIAVYYLDKNKVRFFGAHSVWETDRSKVSICDSGLAYHLEKRGFDGMSVRYELARNAEGERYDAEMARIRKAVEERIKMIDDYIANLKKKQIFIIREKFAYSDFQFGKKFRFYNCFNKRIKYIEITLTNYNVVGDVQRDDIGRTSANLRAIGPIEIGDLAEYEWDEVFWDDNNIIEYTDPTYIKITFFDGTTKVFSGKGNIEKHKADNVYDEW